MLGVPSCIQEVVDEEAFDSQLDNLIDYTMVDLSSVLSPRPIDRKLIRKILSLRFPGRTLTLRGKDMSGFGLYGKVAEIDLSTRKVTITELDEGIYRGFLGGTGLAAKLIHDRVQTKIDPFDPANPLVFAVGP